MRLMVKILATGEGKSVLRERQAPSGAFNVDRQTDKDKDRQTNPEQVGRPFYQKERKKRIYRWSIL